MAIKTESSGRPKLPRNKYGFVPKDGTKSGNNSITSTVVQGGGGIDLDDIKEFTGATSTAAGEKGIVPAPSIGETDKVLRGNGEWGKPYDDIDVSDGKFIIKSSLDVQGEGKIGTTLTTPTIKTDTITKNVGSKIDIQDGVVMRKELSVQGNLICGGKLTSADAEITNLLKTNKISNSDTITTKNLNVTGSAHFFELIIDKIKSSGGSVLFTPADGFDIDKVEYFTTEVTISNGEKSTDSTTVTKMYYKLFWRCDDESKSRKNMWLPGDQAICYSFNKASTGTTQNVNNKYYWSLVSEVSSSSVDVDLYGDGKTYKCNYIVISANRSEYDGTVNPEPGDSIAMLGSRNSDTKRQSAIYISSYSSLDPGIEAPFIAQYQGITDFSLSDHRKSYFGASGSEFIGNFKVSTGDSLEDYINGIISEGKFEVSSPTFIFKSTSEKPNRPTSTSNIPAGWRTTIPGFNTISSIDFVYSGNGELQDNGYRKLPGENIAKNFVKDTISFNTKADYTKITFDLKSSSEASFDFLFVGSPDITYSNRSEIINNAYGKLSGETSKTLDMIVSGVGEHFIEVIYSKDSSINSNDDAGYYKISEVRTRGKIWYSYAIKNSGASGTTYGEWSEPEEWNEPGANGINGSDGAPGADGIDGADAEFYTTFLTDTYAVYTASKLLNYKIKVNLYHIKGEEFESITPTEGEYTLSYSFKNSDGDLLGPYSSTNIVNGCWLISGSKNSSVKYDYIDITVSKGLTVISTNSVPISVKAGAFFSVTDTIEGRVTDAEGNISTLGAQANSIEASIRTINGQISTLSLKDGEIEERVSNAEGDISSLNLSVEGLTSEVGMIKTPKNLKNLLPGTDFRKNGYPGPLFPYCYPRLNYGYDGYPEAYAISKNDSEYSGIHWCYSSPGGNIKVTKGKKYTISCWFKIDTTYNSGSVLFEYIGHNASDESERQLYKSYYPVQDKKGEWLFGSYTFTAEYDYYEIYLLCHRSNGGEIRCEFSCPILEESDNYGGYTLSPLDYDVIKKNLLYNSGLLGYDGNKTNINKLNSRITYSDFQKTEFKSIKFNGISGDYDAIEFLMGAGSDNDYVLSFYAKSDTEDYIRTYFYNGVGNGVTLYSENSDDFIYYPSDGYSLFKLSKDWKRYWVHYRTRSDISYNPVRVLFRFLGKTDTEYTTGYIACPKMEIGTKPTLFTTDTTNDALKDETLNPSSLIKQTKDDIKFYVYDELGKTGIDIQSGEITLDASKTTVNGNLSIRKSTDGITVYDESGNPSIQLSNKNIGNIDSYNMSVSGSINASIQIPTTYKNKEAISLDSDPIKIGSYVTGNSIIIEGCECAFYLKNYGSISALHSCVGTFTVTFTIKNGSSTVYTATRTVTTKRGDISFTEGFQTTATSSGDYFLIINISQTASQVADAVRNSGMNVNGGYFYLNSYYSKFVPCLTDIGSDGLICSKSKYQNLYFGESGFQVIYGPSGSPKDGIRISDGGLGLQRLDSYTDGVADWGSFNRKNVLPAPVQVGYFNLVGSSYVLEVNKYYDAVVCEYGSRDLNGSTIKLPSNAPNGHEITLISTYDGTLTITSDSRPYPMSSGNGNSKTDTLSRGQRKTYMCFGGLWYLTSSV